MSKTKPQPLASIVADPAAFRYDHFENQTYFWSRFGVTQSAGCRYESRGSIPGPLRLLLALYEAGAINDKKLGAIRLQAGLPPIVTPPQTHETGRLKRHAKQTRDEHRE